MKTKKNEPVDSSAWYVVLPCKENGWRPVENAAGKPVVMNTAETNSDYKFFKELHLKQDNVESLAGGGFRYKTVFPYMYECIVYGHNLKHGHIKRSTTSLTEAILEVRLNFSPKVYAALGFA